MWTMNHDCFFSWSILEQIDFIYRATRIIINFYSRSYGRVTTAHWKWLDFWKFAPSVLSVCSQFLSYLLQLQFSHPRSYFLTIFCCKHFYSPKISISQLTTTNLPSIFFRTLLHYYIIHRAGSANTTSTMSTTTSTMRWLGLIVFLESTCMCTTEELHNY